MSSQGISAQSIGHEAILDKSVSRRQGCSRAWHGVLAAWLCLLLAGCVTPASQTRAVVPSPTPKLASIAQPSPTRPPISPTASATPTAPVTPRPRDVAYPVLPAGLSRSQVVRVIDGDTVVLRTEGGQESVRLIGLDAPETHRPNEPVQCFGPDATRRAEQLLTGQMVFLELDPTQGERDKYERLLAYLWLSDGRLFNLEMIAGGYAFEYTYDRPYRYQAEFQRAERDARSGQVGLWSPQTCNGGRDSTTPVPDAARGSGIAAPALRIESIQAAGRDEVITIINDAPSDQVMRGWWIQSSGGNTCQPVPAQRFDFPADYVLPAGALVRVHSGPQTFSQTPGDLFWQVDTVWNNDGDRATLYSPAGAVATFAYGSCR